MKKIKEILVALFVALFAMAAGAACHHQYVQALDEPVVTVGEEIAPVQQEARVEEKAVVHKEICETVTAAEQEQENYYDNLELLAICVEAEAGNQSLEGKRMVASVILNRVDDKDFPDTVEGVISQKGQFASYWDGGMDRITEPSEETILAVQMEVVERGWQGLIYFTAEGFSEYGTPWKKVGDHYFSTK